jgi:hypothetical protein
MPGVILPAGVGRARGTVPPVTDRLPDFIVIGAMKCATTTLHEQLARQPELFLSRPKEPNFFSDDAVYARGLGWYASLFRDAPPAALCGESSTHYTKRPTLPYAVTRMARHLPRVKLVYVMRHPVDRLISHHVHEQTVGRVGSDVDEAIADCPGLIDYGRYAMQIEPYLKTFGTERVLPVFFDRLVAHPQAELERIGAFLGMSDRPVWDHTMEPQNVSRDRLRRSVVREALVTVPLLTPLRQRLFPRSISGPLKALWRTRTVPPTLPPATLARLQALFDDDLAQLGGWLGVELDCRSFHATTVDRPLEWVIRP